MTGLSGLSPRSEFLETYLTAIVGKPSAVNIARDKNHLKIQSGVQHVQPMC